MLLAGSVWGASASRLRWLSAELTLPCRSRRPGLERAAGARHPPGELLARPPALGGVGVDDGAKAAYPAVHQEPEQPEEIDRPRVVSLSARAGKVLDNFLAQHGR